MWNYSFVVPSALMMNTLLGFYLSRPRLPLRVNKTFLGLLVIELLVLASDIVSTKIDENYELFSVPVLYAANTLFFVLFLVRVLWFYRFTIQMLHLTMYERPMFAWLSALPFAIAELVCVSSFATGAVFGITDTGYASGPFYPILVVTQFVYLGLSFGFLVANRKNLRSHDVTVGFFFNLALLVGSVIRVAFPKLLVMDTFCMVAIAIIYLGILNPDLYLSEHGWTFNIRGLRMVLSEPSSELGYGILGFALQNYNHERSILGGKQMDKIVTHIGEFACRAFPHMTTFYLRGGRFVLMGDSAVDPDAVQRTIEDHFGERWHGEGLNVRLPMTFVHADATLELNDPERIINNLVIALDGANRYSSADSSAEQSSTLSTEQVDQQVEILQALETAIDCNQVEVFLQPMFDARTRTLVGAEALARIRGTHGHIIPPGLFIPIAESSGLIDDLGEQVLRKTCSFIQTCDVTSMGLQWINVNLSPIQCLQNDLAERFVGVLEQYGIPTSMIRLEVTEQSMLDYSLLQNQITKLDDAGFKLVMDDYGSGYSNLVRVKQYPFVTIKLDMEIVWDYYHDRDTLLPTIVQGFKAMGLSITAEGIESEDMAQVLADIGTDCLQGYCFSEPIPPREFVAKYLPRPA